MTEIVESSIDSRLYGLFRKQLNLPEAAAMAASIELTEVISQKNTIMKEDTVALFRKEMSEFRAEVNNKFDLFRLEFNNKYDTLHADLQSFKLYAEANFATKAELANVKAELIRWMFLFWISQVLTTFGFLMFFLKK